MHFYNVNAMMLLCLEFLGTFFIGMCGLFAALLKKQRSDFERRWKQREKELTRKRF